MSKRRLLAGCLGLALAAAAGLWLSGRWRARAATTRTFPAADVPVTAVKRGDVQFSVPARGEVQGSNPEMLLAPLTGARELIITSLREPGEMVEPGDTVVQFDTTDQEFALAEAEADVAESEQSVRISMADASAREEELGAAVRQAGYDLKLAELEARKNPLVAAIVAKQNNLAVSAARDRLRQLQQEAANRKTTARNAILIQETARDRARTRAGTARHNIEAMTLRAKTRGYVNIQQNMNQNVSIWGVQLPIYKLGDTVRAGMAVAQIPDLASWEGRALIAELDRGHLAPGQEARISVIALPERELRGRVKAIGGTSGPPWDRKFECLFTVEDPAAELRPGMSVRLVITTALQRDVLWLPSQALYENDGRAFVYLYNGKSFTTAPVTLVRRSESQAVITGLREGQIVAMANPERAAKKAAAGGGPMKALKAN